MIAGFLAVSLDIKRKGVGEQHDETNNIPDEEENDPNRRCVDLIVLGINYRSLEADVKKCFEAFGELIFCEVIINIKPKEIFISSVFFFR